MGCARTSRWLSEADRSDSHRPATRPTTGRYGAWNWAGIAATVLGCVLAWGGLVFSPLRPLYDYAWFVGFGAAALAYVVLAKSARARA